MGDRWLERQPEETSGWRELMDTIIMMSLIFLSGTTGIAIGSVFGLALSRRSVSSGS